MATTEVNLVPLRQKCFTDSKSELKYFEAAAVGTVSVASPTASYRAAIEHGQNGLLARDHEWEDTVMALVDDLLTTRHRYTAMAEAAQRDAEARYTWQRMVPVVERALVQAP